MLRKGSRVTAGSLVEFSKIYEDLWFRSCCFLDGRKLCNVESRHRAIIPGPLPPAFSLSWLMSPRNACMHVLM